MLRIKVAEKQEVSIDITIPAKLAYRIIEEIANKTKATAKERKSMWQAYRGAKDNNFNTAFKIGNKWFFLEGIKESS